MRAAVEVYRGRIVKLYYKNCSVAKLSPEIGVQYSLAELRERDNSTLDQYRSEADNTTWYEEGLIQAVRLISW